MDGVDMTNAATPIETAVDPMAAAPENAGGSKGAGVTASMPAPIEDMPASTAGDAADGPDSGNRPTGCATPVQVAETVSPVAVRKADRPMGRTDNLRQAAHAVLAAWDANAGRDEDIGDAMDGSLAALRAALASTFPPGNEGRQPRDTKQARVIAMLGREDGASGPQVAEAMGWAPHTVRGFLAGLAKKGLKVEVLERVREVGPNKAGAKGSYTVYRLAGVRQQ